MKSNSAIARVEVIRPWIAGVIALAVAAQASPAAAGKIPVSEDTFIDLRLLMQPFYTLGYDPSVTQSSTSSARKFTNDFYLRRTRILMGGQVTKWVSFFMETDMPNWGKGGDWSASTFFVQDAYVSFDIHEAFRVAGGMLMLPFLHQTRQSAASIHTLDYHGHLMRFPTGGDKVWRSTGIELRGLLLRKHIDYRVAVTNGVAHKAEVIPAKMDPDDPTIELSPAVRSNTKDCPRFTGRLAYNFFDAEEGFFLGGTYLGKKKILSVAFAFDAQPAVFGPENAYYGLGGDIFLDYPLGNNRLSGQVDLVYYGGKNNPKRGFGLGMDIGFAIGKWEPIVGFDWFKPDESSGAKDHLVGIHPGLNWWLVGHNANVKLDLGFVKNQGAEFDKMAFVTTLQTQLFF